MTPTPPQFWQDERGARHPAARLLRPLSAVYSAAAAAKWAATTPKKAGVPVICSGNVTLGGVGKTPFTAMLGDVLAGRGLSAHVLSRGYGGRLKGPLRVDPDRHVAADVGDEPLLLARGLPVWIGADRPASAMAATGAGADVLLMDDGFQNPGLRKDLSFLLLDAAAPVGNGLVFPAGPLREPLRRAASRADALVAVGEKTEEATARLSALSGGEPLLWASLAVDLGALDPSRPVHALTGIARPERFHATLQRAGAALTGTTAFADHHPFTEREVERALAKARQDGAVLVTTTKDHVRIPAALGGAVTAIPATMRVSDEARLLSLLQPLFERAL